MNSLKCERSDCFAYYVRRRCGTCTILRDTNFNNKPCPFFKTREQYDKENYKASMKEELK